jgi:GntR family transcriptional regulator
MALPSRTPVVPKYYQVEQQLRRRIATLAKGDALPSEPGLAKELGVSRTTLRAAMDVLVQEGLVERAQGRGTFVVRPKLEYPLAYHLQSGRAVEQQIRHRVLGVQTVDAGPELGEVFGVVPSHRVLTVRRLSFWEDTPTALDTLWVPTGRGTDLAGADFSGGRFFYVLAAHGIAVARNRISIESVIIDAATARQMAIRPGLPGISLTRLAFDHGGDVVALVRIVTRGDVARYIMEFPVEPPGAHGPDETVDHGTRPPLLHLAPISLPGGDLP